MMNFRIACELNWSREDFWKIRAHPEFIAFLVRDGTLHRMALSKKFCTADGKWHRRQTYVPKSVDFSELIMKLIGDSLFTIGDYLTWNEDAEHPDYTQLFEVTPSVLASSVKTSGVLKLEPLEESNDKCVHVLEGSINVNIFAIGYFVEQAVHENMKLFYKLYPESVRKFKQYVIEKEAEYVKANGEKITCESAGGAQGVSGEDSAAGGSAGDEPADLRNGAGPPSRGDEEAKVSENVNEFSRILESFLARHPFDDYREDDPQADHHENPDVNHTGHEVRAPAADFSVPAQQDGAQSAQGSQGEEELGGSEVGAEEAGGKEGGVDDAGNDMKKLAVDVSPEKEAQLETLAGSN